MRSAPARQAPGGASWSSTFRCFSRPAARRRVDAVVVVTAPEEMQRAAHSMARTGMTRKRVAALLARQMPDAEKRARAHFVIDTSGEFAATREQVGDVMRALAGKIGA